MPCQALNRVAQPYQVLDPAVDTRHFSGSESALVIMQTLLSSGEIGVSFCVD